MWKKYLKNKPQDLRPYVVGEVLSSNCSIGPDDRENGSPQQGDMIARNALDHSKTWLVSQVFFDENYVLVP